MVVQSIRNNVSALQVIHQLNRTDNRIQTSIERLSTGLRINRAKDDPSGLVVSSKLETQFRGLNRASENAQEASNLADVATGAIDGIVEHLNAIRVIALSAASGGGTSTQQAEIRERLEEIDLIAQRTRFGSRYLLNGSYASTVSFKTGTRNFGGSISFGPNASTLYDGTSFLKLARVQEGSERISSGGDGSVNTGIRLATDIAVSTGQFAQGAALAAGGDQLQTLTFNRVTLIDPGRIVFNGVLADGSTPFSGTLSISATATVNDFVSALQSSIDSAETGLGINTGGGTGAYETSVQYDASTGRLQFYSGAAGTPSQFDITFNVYRDSSTTMQTSSGIERVATIGNEFVSVGDTGARIGNSLTAITGSTFATGAFDIEVISVQSAAQRLIALDQGFYSDALGTTSVNTGDNIEGSYFGGIQIENGDTFEISGTDPDGTTFSTIFTVAAVSGGVGSGIISDYQDFLNELRVRDRSQTGFGFNNAFATLSSGFMQIQDDVANTSYTDFSILFTDVSTSTTVSADSTVITAGNRERASISLAGGTSTLVEAGEVVTLTGGNAVGENEPVPTVTLRVGSGFAVGNDSLVVKEQIYEGSLNGGSTVQFRNGQSHVLFTSGSSSRTSSQPYQTLTLDFDRVLNITSPSSGTGEVFELISTSNAMTFHLGEDKNQNKNFFFADLRIDRLGLNSSNTLDNINITTVSGANEALDIIDAALDQVNIARGRIGAFSSSVSTTIDELNMSSLHVQKGYEQIVNADMAKETTRLTLNMVLLQAQTAILIQANTVPVKIYEMLYGID